MSLLQSTGFLLVGKLIEALQAESGLAGLTVVRNPRRPADLAKGERLLIVAERSDTLIQREGLRDRRRRFVTVGALSRKEGADADADALAQLASDTVSASLKEMVSVGEVGRMGEQDIQFHVDDLDVDGAIVVSGWEIEYYRERPKR